MNQIIAETVKKLLNLTDEELSSNSLELEDINAFYFWSSGRGGKAMIINDNGEKLVATSAVRFDDHLKAFKMGKRN